MTPTGRQLILCCDGTNDNLTGRAHDTNVVKLCELLAADPDPQRLVFYDPGVGHAEAAPATDLIEALKQSLERWLALAFGRGVYDNVAEGYRFLMEHHRPGDEIYLFGFSRGAFTARSIGGMVNQFGLLAPHLAPLVPTLVSLYFAERRPGAPGDARAVTSAQAARLFTPQDRRQVPLQYTGVWDTVASVGTWPSKARFTAKPDLGDRKHFVHVRQALSLDELRAQFAPRLYLGPNGPHTTVDGLDGSLAQLWFSGDHCDVGGGHAHDESALSDEAMRWLVSEAVRCGLRLRHEGRALDTEAGVAEAAQALGLSAPAAPGRVHRQLRARRMWALTGMAMRDTGRVTWDGGEAPHEPLEHPSVVERAGSIREVVLPQAWGSLALAAAVLLLGFFCTGQMLHGFTPQGSVWADLQATLGALGSYAQAQLCFTRWQLGAWEPGALARLVAEAPRAALVTDALLLIPAYAFLLAGPATWAFARLAGLRRAGDRAAPAALRRLGWALPAMVGADLLEDLTGWLALSLQGSTLFPDLPSLLVMAMSLACWAKWIALAGVLGLVAWGAMKPAARAAPRGNPPARPAPGPV